MDCEEHDRQSTAAPLQSMLAQCYKRCLLQEKYIAKIRKNIGNRKEGIEEHNREIRTAKLQNILVQLYKWISFHETEIAKATNDTTRLEKQISNRKQVLETQWERIHLEKLVVSRFMEIVGIPAIQFFVVGDVNRSAVACRRHHFTDYKL